MTKPNLEEILNQCAKLGLPDVEGEKFLNYYESNGWRVGRNPMKSWTHALNNWRLNYEQQSKPTGVKAGSVSSGILLQLELKRIEDRLKRIIDISPSTMCDGVILSAEHKQERAKLLERKREVLAKLGFKA